MSRKYLFTGKSFISEIEQGINTYFITDMCKLQFICKIANMERARESNGCNVKGGWGRISPVTVISALTALKRKDSACCERGGELMELTATTY